MSGLPVLKAAPPLVARAETVDVPELGGAVVVHGLLASEAFALTALRSRALRAVREARQEHQARCQALPPDQPHPEFEPPELDMAELKLYGRYLSELLAVAVRVENGLGLYSADEWELVGQHHPAVPGRLQAVAERLSGLDAEDVRKNSPSSPS